MAQHGFPTATGRARPPYRRVIDTERTHRHIEAHGETRDYEYVYERLDCGHVQCAGEASGYRSRPKRPCYECRKDAEEAR